MRHADAFFAKTGTVEPCGDRGVSLTLMSRRLRGLTVITYPDRTNPGLGQTVDAPASAASGGVEDGGPTRFADTEYGKQFPQRESLGAVGRRVEIR
ncbi:hypothetical protein ACIF85_32625 [Streptomyces sp. NPDC086033]|uniref:hypothetical protein n=1 Tax=Streptomyces sp. NPDC086033 TaxID=3365747 RepID=UPI0037D58F43